MKLKVDLEHEIVELGDLLKQRSSEVHKYLSEIDLEQLDRLMIEMERRIADETSDKRRTQNRIIWLEFGRIKLTQLHKQLEKLNKGESK